MNEFGGDDGVAAIYRYNHELAWWAGQYLADRWDTRFTTPEEMIGSMVNVRLPAELGSSRSDAERVRAALETEGIEVAAVCRARLLDDASLGADLLRPRRHRTARRRRGEASDVATARQYLRIAITRKPVRKIASLFAIASVVAACGDKSDTVATQPSVTDPVETTAVVTTTTAATDTTPATTTTTTASDHDHDHRARAIVGDLGDPRRHRSGGRRRRRSAPVDR